MNAQQQYNATRGRAAQIMREHLIETSTAAPQRKANGVLTRTITLNEGTINLIASLLQELENLHRDILAKDAMIIYPVAA